MYNITNTGYERCRDIPHIDLNRIPYHYEQPTGTQAGHELLITKTAVSIYEYVRQQKDVRILEEGRFMLQQLSWFDKATSEDIFPFEHVIPDYWYLALDRNGLMIRFVEVIVGEASITNIRRKLEEYERWSQTDDVQKYLCALYTKWGAKEPKPEFQLHCILESRNWKHTDEWKERMTMMQTFHVNPMMQGRVWTTTKEALDAALAEGVTINHPIWHRGKDLIGDKRERWKTAASGTRTRLVDQFMRAIPTYPLFA